MFRAAQKEPHFRRPEGPCWDELKYLAKVRVGEFQFRLPLHVNVRRCCETSEALFAFGDRVGIAAPSSPVIGIGDRSGLSCEGLGTMLQERAA